MKRRFYAFATIMVMVVVAVAVGYVPMAAADEWDKTPTEPIPAAAGTDSAPPH